MAGMRRFLNFTGAPARRKWYERRWLFIVLACLFLPVLIVDSVIVVEHVGRRALESSRLSAGSPSQGEPVGPPAPVPFSAPPLVPYPMKLAPGITILGGLAPAAAYVVETPEGLVLIDSGIDDDAGPLKAQMEAAHLDWRRVRAILLTHAHKDHTGGAQHLRAATGAKVYVGEGDAGVVSSGGPREAFFGTFSFPDQQLHPTTVDVELKGGESITLGRARFRALAMPGHTPGSICYYLERDGLRVLFSGDVISMLRGDPESPELVRRPLGTYTAYLAPRYRGDARSYLASLRKLLALPVPNLVLPGHPRADKYPENPCFTQARWQELLERGIRDMEALLSRYEADGALFLDKTRRSWRI
jgi:glyoxylase-like metal-dependent hydrolase (beta-lactamase superfamily II)